MAFDLPATDRSNLNPTLPDSFRFFLQKIGTIGYWRDRSQQKNHRQCFPKKLELNTIAVKLSTAIQLPPSLQTRTIGELPILIPDTKYLLLFYYFPESSPSIISSSFLGFKRLLIAAQIAGTKVTMAMVKITISKLFLMIGIWPSK